MATFSREQITVTMSSSFKPLHTKKDVTETYISEKIVTDFYFFVTVPSEFGSIKDIEILKNGIEYKDISKERLSKSEYCFREPEPIGIYNTGYTVKVILNNGNSASKTFCVKVRHKNDDNSIKINSLSSYGLHENFSILKIIADISSGYDIYKVKLYCKETFHKKYKYIGTLQKRSGDNDIYETEYPIFDSTLTEKRHTVFKIKVYNIFGEIKEKTLETVLEPSKLSLNNVNISDRSIEGGITFRLKNKLSEFNNKIFSIILSNSKANTFIKIMSDNYEFFADNMIIEYPESYNSLSTDVMPNIYKIKAKGNILYTEGEKQCSDRGMAEVNFFIGTNIYCNFYIWADNYEELSLNTDKTRNSVITAETDEGLKIYDSVYMEDSEEDDEPPVTGFLTQGESLNYYDVYNDVNYNVNTIRSSDYLDADHIAYNNEHIYYINYYSDGIDIVQSDGFNFIDYKAEVNLPNETLNNLKHNRHVRFNSDNDLIIDFFNYNGRTTLQRVNITNRVLETVDYAENLQMAYNELAERMIGHINSLGNIEINGKIYLIEANSSFDYFNGTFTNFGYENIIQKFIVLQLKADIKIPVVLKKYNTSANTWDETTITVNAKCIGMTQFTDTSYDVESCCFYFNGMVDNKRFDYEYETKNINPKNIMELSSKRYYIKFENSVSSTLLENYGSFRTCDLYNKSVKLCPVPKTVLDFTDRKYYFYSDFSRLYIIMYDYLHVIFLNYVDDNVYMTLYNINSNDIVWQKQIKSNIIFNDLMLLPRTNFETLEYIFNGISSFEKYRRIMKIYTSADKGKDILHVSYDSKTETMEKITDISYSSEDSNSFYYEYPIEYDINIKNLNKYLSTVSTF